MIQAAARSPSNTRADCLVQPAAPSERVPRPRQHPAGIQYKPTSTEITTASNLNLGQTPRGAAPRQFVRRQPALGGTPTLSLDGVDLPWDIELIDDDAEAWGPERSLERDPDYAAMSKPVEKRRASSSPEIEMVTKNPCGRS